MGCSWLNVDSLRLPGQDWLQPVHSYDLRLMRVRAGSDGVLDLCAKCYLGLGHLGVCTGVTVLRAALIRRAEHCILDFGLASQCQTSTVVACASVKQLLQQGTNLMPLVYG